LAFAQGAAFHPPTFAIFIVLDQSRQRAFFAREAGEILGRDRRLEAGKRVADQ
jgi:hypothetical protein